MAELQKNLHWMS